MKITSILTACMFGILSMLKANTILVQNPGNGNDIMPNLSTAYNNALSGDTILLPQGNFIFSGSLTFSISQKPNLYLKGYGAEPGGTKISRGNIESSSHLIEFKGDKTLDMKIEISDIWFQGKQVYLDSVPNNAYFYDRGIMLMGVNAYVHHCKFQWFAYSAISITHETSNGMTLISDNEFLDNVTRMQTQDFSGGYGVLVSGMANYWTNVEPGSDKFVFIEDNFFSGHRHVVGGAECGLYVFRHNYVERNANTHPLDLHGARPPHMSSYQYSTRFAEIYENTVISTPEWSPLFINYNDNAVNVRGGEALIFNNVFKDFENPINLQIEYSWYSGSLPSGYTIPNYPIPYQIGYESGLQYGNVHSGRDTAHAKGDVFIWNNHNLGNVINDVDISGPTSYIQENRDYHKTKKPDYSPFAYPHPKRNNPGNINITPKALAKAQPYHGDTSTVFQLNSSFSYDPDHNIQQIHWDFGDGQSSNADNPSHKYAQSGTFDVVLTITYGGGDTHSDTINLEVYLSTDSLVGHWPLDEQTGTQANDLSPYANHGSLNGGIIFDSNSVTGMVNDGLDFDGVDDFIDCGIDQSLLFNSNEPGISIATWVYLDSWPGYAYIIDRSHKDYAFATANSDKVFRFLKSDGAGSFELASMNLEDEFEYGQWNHFVITFNRSSKQVFFYCNGVQVDSEYMNSSALYHNSSENLTIGKKQVGNWFDGKLDDIRIYNRPISYWEVKELYQPKNELNVLQGVGDGMYLKNMHVQVQATIPAGKQFKKWIGDTIYLQSTTDSVTSLQMPNHNISIEATFHGGLVTNNLQNITIQKINLYPNPTSGMLFLQGNPTHLAHIRIVDVYGKTVLQKTNINESEGIDLSNCKTGIYFLNYTIQDQVYTHKIIKY